MTRNRSRRRRPGQGETFRDITQRTEREVDPLWRFHDMGSGDFLDDDRYLIHRSGIRMTLVEPDIEIDDAQRILTAGADLYYNPDEMPFNTEGTMFTDIVQKWMEGAEAAALLASPPVIAANMPPIQISLYESVDGDFTLHVSGFFSGGPSAAD